MKTKSLFKKVILITGIFLLLSQRGNAQTTFVGHLGLNPLTDYLGWNAATGIALTIRHDGAAAGNDIDFYTGGFIPANKRMTILGPIPPATAGFIGIGTAAPNTTLEINSGLAATTGTRLIAGLRFTQLLPGPPSPNDILPHGKVLTVDANGEVGLTSDAGFAGAENAAWINPANGKIQWGTNPLIQNTEIPMADPTIGEFDIYFTGQSTMITGNPPNRVDIGIGYPTTTVPLLAKLDVKNETGTFGSYFFNNQYAGRFYQTGSYSRTGLLATDDMVGIWAKSDVAHLGGSDLSTNIGGDFYAFNGYYNNIGVRAEANALINCTGVKATAISTISAIGVDASAKGGAVQNYGVFSQAIPAAGATNFGVYAGAITGGVPPAGSVNIALYADLLGNPMCLNPAICPGYPPTAPDFAGYFDGDVLCTANMYVLSDAALKTNIQSLTNPMGLISLLQPKSYSFNHQANQSMILPNGTQAGLLAQDVFAVAPQLTKDCVHPARYDSLGNQIFAPINFKAINYSGFIPYLIGAMKQLDSTNQALQNQMNALSAQVENCCGSGLLQENPNDGDNNSGRTGNTQNQNHSIVLSGMNEPYIGQNIPNPFSEETRIDYYIPETRFCGSGSCQIIFYDQLGRVLQQTSIEKSGYGTISVSTKNLANGILTYKLLVNGEVIDVKKMLFAK
ncbi:MAG TPA: tail fiber domain-containing protein [Bacteroidia bacterium]|nr:tail fiber domain-containing protein [Bacteroidia bacterium]